MTRTFIVDASVCLKWIFEDEIYSNQALAILENFLDSKINLIAPNILMYEVANGIRSVSVKNKLTAKKSIGILRKILKSFPNFVEMEEVMNICLRNSLKYDISVYDAAYITLADAHGITFVTADDKLVDTVNDPKLAISLKDIKIKA